MGVRRLFGAGFSTWQETKWKVCMKKNRDPNWKGDLKERDCVWQHSFRRTTSALVVHLSKHTARNTVAKVAPFCEIGARPTWTEGKPQVIAGKQGA